MRTEGGGARRSGGLTPGVRRSLAALALGVTLLGACGPRTKAAATVSKNDLLEAGLHAQASGNTALADTDYLNVLKSEPNSTLAWYNLGVIAQKSQADSAAEKDYTSAIGTNGTYVPALYNLAILVTAKDPNEAEALYRRCIAAQPSDANAYLNISFVERRLGHAALARADVDRAIALDPSLGVTTRKR